jgi:hypothetical protein
LKKKKQIMLNRIFYKFLLSIILSTVYIAATAQCNDVYIAGLMDGYTGSAIPKFVLICATEDIPDLSIYAVGSANNGGGTSAPGEYIFPDDALDAGDCVTLATEVPMFLDYFGCNPTYTNGSAINVNGDDAIELFCNGTLIDIYGDANVDGTGEAWEYTDGWAVRLNASTFPNTIFSTADWTIAPDQTPEMHHFNDNGMMTVDCPACNIVSITAGTQSSCDPVTNTFTQEITIDFTGGPGTGNLVVNNQIFTLGSSPQTVTLSGLNSDGSDVDVIVEFSDLPACTSTELALFTAPTECLVVPPVCSISNVTIQNIVCDDEGINAELCFDYEDPLSTEVSVSIDNLFIGNFSYPTVSGGCITVETTDFFSDTVELLVEDSQSSVPIYISEFHYDNESTDIGEFIEITAPVGTSLTGYSLVLYNGTTNSVYETIDLSGDVMGTDGGCGVLAFDATGIQNGPDAIALVDASGNVIEFISYEGVLNAIDGPASGMMSTDIGVQETSSSSTTTSLSLVNGEWIVADTNSRGALNMGARCVDPCEGTVSFEAPDCCSDFDIVASAFCSDMSNTFVESNFYIEVESISGGQNSGSYNVTVQGVTQTYIGTPITFGPVSHSGNGNSAVSVIVAEIGSNCIDLVQVVETLCTDINGVGGADNDMAFCQCDVTSGNNNPGVIFSQAQPGTFMAGGSSDQTQVYLLSDSNTGTITVIDANGIGLFNNLMEGIYYVYAVNYDNSNSADVQAALVTGQSIDIMDFVDQEAPYDDECYTVCGPATYDIECSPNQGTLGCNDHLNITLSTECTVSITPSILLQGEQAPDENYSYVVTDSNGNVVDVDNLTSTTSDDPINFINQDLTFTVLDICSGNTCWGTITLEDKSIPELNCSDVTVLCTEVDNISPGAPIKGWDRDVIRNQTVSGTNGTVDFTIDKVIGTVTNVILNFEADIQDVSNLGLSLSSPNGQSTFALISQSGFSDPCEQNNINVCLTDDAMLSHSDLQSPVLCRSTRNAIIGDFRPLIALSGFNGDDANGTWTLTITNDAGTSVDVLEADLQVTTSEGNLLTSDDIISFGGCQSMPEFSFEDIETGMNCVDGLWSTISRRWTVSNPSSGRTNSCNQLINVRLYTLDDIIWPKDFNDIDQPSLQCDDIVDTGMPMLPCGSTVNACNFLISDPTIIDFPICGDSYKRVNTWTVLDWCTGESLDYNQIVKVEDTEPIVVTCVPDQLTQAEADAIGFNMETQVYQATLDGGSCTGSWVIQPPLVIDNTCNTNTTLQVFFLPDDDNDPSDPPVNGEYILATGDVITGLPADRRTWIRMVVTDECGNTGECFTEVDVMDDVRPTCIAEEFIVVGLSQQDDDLYGRVSAISVDNGSFDCSELTYQIRRFSSSCNPFDLLYGDFVEFCCDDLDANGLGEIPVELRVTDAGGNFCIVTSTIKIENKIPNSLVCPDGQIVDCLADISDLSVTGLPSSDGACGVVNLDLDEASIVDNTIPAVKPAGASPLFDIDGDGSSDAVPAFDEGCGFGALRRTFFDGSQMICEQYFVITPVDPLELSDITFPSDMTTDCNAVDPGQPEFSRSPCSNLGFTIESDTIRVVNDACYKIFNTHTVIDWCRYDLTDGQEGIYSEQQVITVIDDRAPVISAEDNLEFTFTQGCSASSIIIPALAVDNVNCNNDILNWIIEVDYDSDGTIDVRDTDSSLSGDSLFVEISNVPLGKTGHSVRFIVEDACDNNSETEVTFTVIDRKAPTPYCLNVATATMDNGSVEIWANDFDLGSTDNCTANENLRFTFSDIVPPATSSFYNPASGTITDEASFNAGDSDRWDATLGTAGRLIFDSDINADGFVILEMYVWDECDNFDFCLVQLAVNGNDIPDTGAISGRIYTEYGEAVQSVNASLDNMSNNSQSAIVTNENGEYAFYENIINNQYNIKGEKNDDYLNGVSTYDLILIQKHILNDELLDSPYKMIAADISNDKKITAIDLIQLRKLILGVNDGFDNNGSWKFVDQQDNLTTDNPWYYHDFIEIENLSDDMNTQDFIAVKIGDVNNSMVPNVVSQGTALRRNNALEFVYTDAYVNKGELISIDLNTESTELFGYQFSFEADGLEVTYCEGRDMYDENYHIDSNGRMTVSHNTDYPIDNTSAILTISLKAEKNGWLSEMIRINSQYTKAEAYVGTELEVMDIVLRESSEEQFDLYQNEPNPFSEETTIGFELPHSATVSMSLYNVSGQLIKTMVIDGVKGYNSLTLQKEDIGVTGLIYYKLESNKFSATKHMILIE